MKRRLLSLLSAISLSALSACQPSRADRARTSAPPPAATPALPEDAVAGQLALARWTEHLEEEEHARQANYDRRRLPEHRSLVARLEQARARYAAARSPAAVTRAQAQFRARLPAFNASLERLDRWGRSSHLLKDYRALLELLADDYPSAKLAALAGSRQSYERLDGELDSRLASVHDWLKFAAEAEEE